MFSPHYTVTVYPESVNISGDNPCLDGKVKAFRALSIARTWLLQNHRGKAPIQLHIPHQAKVQKKLDALERLAVLTEPCKQCDATGRMLLSDYDSSNAYSPGHRTIKCDRCQGAGYVKPKEVAHA